LDLINSSIDSDDTLLSSGLTILLFADSCLCKVVVLLSSDLSPILFSVIPTELPLLIELPAELFESRIKPFDETGSNPFWRLSGGPNR